MRTRSPLKGISGGGRTKYDVNGQPARVALNSYYTESQIPYLA